MLLFRSEEHIDRWCAFRELPKGATLTPEQNWQLARAWYGEKLSPSWRRKTTQEIEALFSSIGLLGSFWNF